MATVCVFSAAAQDNYAWWDAIHQWDGHTPRYKYVRIAPAFMGPNALPVPVVQDGIIGRELEVENAISAYFGKGDFTADWFARVQVPIAENKVTLTGYVVPLEYYKTDTITRDLRAGLTHSGEDYAGGDIYFSTHIQICRNRKSLPDAAFEAAFKTASGTHLRDARYTDASGYFFQLSFGKTHRFHSFLSDSIRWFATSGFYSWQTYDDLNHQNDAPLYGLGLSFSKKGFTWKSDMGGYSGYFNNGDHPLVLRSQLAFSSARFRYELLYQEGLQDFPFSGFRFSLIFHTNVFRK